MSIIGDYILGVKTLREQLPEITRKIVNRNKIEILEYYKVNQIGSGIKKGVRKDGVIIGTYSQATQEEWFAFWNGAPPYSKDFREPYNLEWTGNFFRGMFIFFEDKFSYSISSRDNKTPKLLKSYGDLFTLTDNTREHVENNFIIPVFADIIDKRLSAII